MQYREKQAWHGKSRGLRLLRPRSPKTLVKRRRAGKDHLQKWKKLQKELTDINKEKPEAEGSLDCPSNGGAERRLTKELGG